ncbi:hypothetical protein [Herbaspirillum rubrisubalbicans]|uniref:Uncharacterized protein n=1 Tax=Herbaspirillum rubrisubalbicans TaxID=80842 RepID=A0AAD0UBA9_9BURK|nr:hypothetical protein [Herbaspirillum rubrisubalbicans]AYR25781.1 hypothetical protein RC54_19050 [Herbaspirillum rubrisubalbicans]
MEKQQLDKLVGLIGGCETAIVTLADCLHKAGVLDKEALSAHYDATAHALPQEIPHREVIQMVLGHIARGLRSAKDQEDLIGTLFH